MVPPLCGAGHRPPGPCGRGRINEIGGDILPHKFPQHLRRGPILRLTGGQELLAQLLLNPYPKTNIFHDGAV